MPEDPLKILVVEDEPTLRHGLSDLLEGAGHIVEAVDDGLKAVARGVSPEVEMVVLDLALPGIDGLEVCRRLRAARPELLILMLTARAREDDKVEGLSHRRRRLRHQALRRARAAGADRGAGAAVPPRRLHAASRADRARRLRCSTSAAAPPAATARPSPLTAREVRILRLLYQNRVRAMTRGELLEKAWGASSNLQTRTVDMTIANLRQKIERDASVPRIVTTVKGVGYAWGRRDEAVHTRLGHGADRPRRC